MKATAIVEQLPLDDPKCFVEIELPKPAPGPRVSSSLNEIVATRSEPVHGVLGGDAGQGRGDGLLEFLPGASLRNEIVDFRW